MFSEYDERCIRGVVRTEYFHSSVDFLQQHQAFSRTGTVLINPILGVVFVEKLNVPSPCLEMSREKKTRVHEPLDDSYDPPVYGFRF